MISIAFIASNWLANRWPREVDNEEAMVTFDGKIDEEDCLELEWEFVPICSYEDYREVNIVDIDSDVSSADNLVEGEVNVDPQHQQHLVDLPRQVLRETTDIDGDIVSVPHSGVDCVVITEAKDCVEGAKKRIQEIVADLEDMVSFDAKIEVEDCLEWDYEPISSCTYEDYREMNIVDFDWEVSSAAYQSVDTDFDDEEDIINELEWDYEYVLLYEEDEINVDIDWDVFSADNLVEGEVNVDPQHQQHLVDLPRQVLRETTDVYRDNVSVPHSGVDCVVITEAKDCIEGAKKRIQEVVADLDTQVTVECVITQQFDQKVLGGCDANVQAKPQELDVIKFPIWTDKLQFQLGPIHFHLPK